MDRAGEQRKGRGGGTKWEKGIKRQEGWMDEGKGGRKEEGYIWIKWPELFKSLISSSNSM